MTQEICIFCQKNINEVELIFKKKDRTTAICGECIDIAADLLQDKRESAKNRSASTINKRRVVHNLSNWEVDEKLARTLGLEILLHYGVIPSSTRSTQLRFVCHDLDNLYKKNPTFSEIMTSLKEFNGENITGSYILATKEDIENKINEIFENNNQ